MACPTVEDIDSLLPQTQCEQCGYPGCLPYAQAIIENNEKINKCVPGGIATLHQLGHLLQQETACLESELQEKQKPRTVAKINEELCIGCTKCIAACPIDAIIGSAKRMHVILTNECTGCKLCIEPCPMDCITLVPLTVEYTPLEEAQRIQKRKFRFNQRNERLARLKLQKQNQQAATQQTTAPTCEPNKALQQDLMAARKAYIADAVARVKQKKKQN